MDDEEKELEEEEKKLSEEDLFLYHLNSTLAVKKNHDMKLYDYEWLDKIEDTLPYLDNILRNPKSFIINEEEIVKVELSKKVTVESVIHLTQHTNLIQKIEDNGDVKPSKILNINKEESLDTYENRFIFTLINNLRLFLDMRIAATSGMSYSLDKNLLQYEANSKVNGELLKISLNITDVTKDVFEDSGTRNHMNYPDRIRKVKTQLDGFMGTEMMQNLTRLHVPPVRSPIKKTNVILKNPNFQKAEELWNYIQMFESKDQKEKEQRDYFDRGNLKYEYDQAFLSTFLANKNFLNDSSPISESSIINQMVQRLIENLLDTDPDLTEEKIQEIVTRQIRLEKEKNDNRRERIYSILDSRLKREYQNFLEIGDFYKKEADYE